MLGVVVPRDTIQSTTEDESANKVMKTYLYLDDERPNPDPNRWEVIKTAPELIARLAKLGQDLSRVVLSLDHDLGVCPACLLAGGELPIECVHCGTGYDVLLYLEEQAVTNPKFQPPARIQIHTANAAARPRMVKAVESIYLVR